MLVNMTSGKQFPDNGPCGSRFIDRGALAQKLGIVTGDIRDAMVGIEILYQELLKVTFQARLCISYSVYL